MKRAINLSSTPPPRRWLIISSENEPLHRDDHRGNRPAYGFWASCDVRNHSVHPAGVCTAWRKNTHRPHRSTRPLFHSSSVFGTVPASRAQEWRRLLDSCDSVHRSCSASAPGSRWTIQNWEKKKDLDAKS